VRKLAERTTQSTQEIAGMVADIQNGASSAVQSMENGVSRVERGVRLANGTGQSMQQVAASATSVSAAVADISNAIREQSVAGQEIAQRVEQVAQMSEERHGAAEQSADHATRLVKRFVLIGTCLAGCIGQVGRPSGRLVGLKPDLKGRRKSR